MAKALLGYISTTPEPRVAARLATDNRLLRQRVADLEAIVVRLMAENDALAALAVDVKQDVLESV